MEGSFQGATMALNDSGSTYFPFEWICQALPHTRRVQMVERPLFLLILHSFFSICPHQQCRGVIPSLGVIPARFREGLCHAGAHTWVPCFEYI